MRIPPRTMPTPSLSRCERLSYPGSDTAGVEVEGRAFSQGYQRGLALGDRIARNLDVYFDRLQREGQLEPAEVRVATVQAVPPDQCGGHLPHPPPRAPSLS